MKRVVEWLLVLALLAGAFAGVAALVLPSPLFEDFARTHPYAASVRSQVIKQLPEKVTGVPAIEPPTNEVVEPTDPNAVVVTVRYQGHRLRIPVVVSDVDRAYDVDIAAVWTGDATSRTERAQAYVRRYVKLPMIESATRELRAIRKRYGLDRSEYAELLATFVQSIKYSSPPDRSMRSPVGVIVHKRGDCDEKALLLVTLLRHEGYDCALLQFEPEEHTAVGIRSERLRFAGTRYAFLETTRPMYIGEVGRSYRANGVDVELESKPVVMPLGGSQTWDAGRQVDYILRRRAAASRRVDELKPVVEEARKRSYTNETEWRAANRMIDRYNDAVDVVNTTLTGCTSRPQTYRWLRAHR